MYHVKHNIIEVSVESVKSLSSAQEKKLLTTLEKKLNKKVVVNHVLNPELLGGLRIQYNSNMIDDSIMGKLNRLEIMMKGGH